MMNISTVSPFTPMMRHWLLQCEHLRGTAKHQAIGKLPSRVQNCQTGNARGTRSAFILIIQNTGRIFLSRLRECFVRCGRKPERAMRFLLRVRVETDPLTLRFQFAPKDTETLRLA